MPPIWIAGPTELPVGIRVSTIVLRKRPAHRSPSRKGKSCHGLLELGRTGRRAEPAKCGKQVAQRPVQPLSQGYSTKSSDALVSSPSPNAAAALRGLMKKQHNKVTSGKMVRPGSSPSDGLGQLRRSRVSLLASVLHKINQNHHEPPLQDRKNCTWNKITEAVASSFHPAPMEESSRQTTTSSPKPRATKSERLNGNLCHVGAPVLPSPVPENGSTFTSPNSSSSSKGSSYKVTSKAFSNGMW